MKVPARFALPISTRLRASGSRVPRLGDGARIRAGGRRRPRAGARGNALACLRLSMLRWPTGSFLDGQTSTTFQLLSESRSRRFVSATRTATTARSLTQDGRASFEQHSPPRVYPSDAQHPRCRGQARVSTPYSSTTIGVAFTGDERCAVRGADAIVYWFFSQAAQENGDLRVYAGIHFRSAVVDGIDQGKRSAGSCSPMHFTDRCSMPIKKRTKEGVEHGREEPGIRKRRDR